VLALLAVTLAYEKAIFPMSVMQLTQIAFETYSHTNSYHIDCIGAPRAVAPFTGKIIYVDRSSYGVMAMTSTDKVYYANGKLDYMTVIFMHGYLINGYGKGSVVPQGKEFYQVSGIGSGGRIEYGTHLDLGIRSGNNQNIFSPWSKYGNVMVYDALFINPSFTKSIINPGKAVRSVSRSVPTNYSGLWKKTTGTPPPPPPSSITVTFQVYDSNRRAWLPNVKNTNSANSWAGILGHPISAVYASLSSGNIYYKVHSKGGYWYPEVKNRSDYAGVYNKNIDGISMRTDTGKTIYYRVHVVGGGWYPFVTGYNTNASGGWAGKYGNIIDGLQIYIK